MARELFIYWRVGAGEARAALALAAEMQRDLQARHPGMQARLYRRADDPPGTATLMEVYARPPHGVDTALEAAIAAAAAAALAPHYPGPRHVEPFEAHAA